jgi:hypothetical protein
MQPPMPTLADCKGAEPCFDAVFRPEVKAGYLDCVASRACNKADDDCWTAPLMEHPETQASKTYSAACLQRYKECSTFIDDWCFSAPLLDSEIAKFSACLQKPCDQAKACFEAELQAAKMACNGTFGL